MGQPIVHFELGGVPAESVAAFYEKHFGWQIGKLPEMDYYGITTAEGSLGGGLSGEADAGTVIYIEVPDIQAAMKAIIEDGGSEVIPETKIPDVVTFAVFQDPAGNKIGLVKADGAS
jgi:predicted enzyme related to lactoylglutathione lyase